jgi:pantoate--beta-alanine ligase
MTLPVFHAIADLRRALAADSGPVALVPTMGALHDGHLTLMQDAARRAARVVVSIFVNPTQFAPHEDLAAYPRDLKSDVAKLASLGPLPILVFAPDTKEIYPAPCRTSLALGDIAARWEGEARPTHFGGVALVVNKLLNIVQPDIAIFGEKDFQQLQVIRQMVRDLSMRTEIIGHPTVREPSGLALSSRNQYLSPYEREAIAPHIHAALSRAANAIRNGDAVEKILIQEKTALLSQGFGSVDYLAYVESETLNPLSHLSPLASRLLFAGRLGTTRLIDNLAVT